MNRTRQRNALQVPMHLVEVHCKTERRKTQHTKCEMRQGSIKSSTQLEPHEMHCTGTARTEKSSGLHQEPSIARLGAPNRIACPAHCKSRMPGLQGGRGVNCSREGAGGGRSHGGRRREERGGRGFSGGAPRRWLWNREEQDGSGGVCGSGRRNAAGGRRGGCVDPTAAAQQEAVGAGEGGSGHRGTEEGRRGRVEVEVGGECTRGRAAPPVEPPDWWPDRPPTSTELHQDDELQVHDAERATRW